METRIVGCFEFARDLADKEIEKINSFEFSKAYDQYAIGAWETCWLWNRSGNINEMYSSEYDGFALPTQYGKKLEYINSVIHDLFEMKLCKAVRVMAASKGGIIIPHIDYLEFKRGFTRIHLPLAIDQQSFFSEESDVVTFRPGEIWFVEGRKCHSGGSFSKNRRLNIVLDFDTEYSLNDIFRCHDARRDNITPHYISRKKFTPAVENTVLSMSEIINKSNFRDILFLLSKIHFFYEVDNRAVYDWLIEISNRSGDTFLENIAKNIKSFFLERGPSVTFPLDEL